MSVYRGQPSKLRRDIRVEKSVVSGTIPSRYVDAVGDGTTLSIREAGVFRYQHGVPHDSSDWRVGVMSFGLCNDRCARGEPRHRAAFSISRFFSRRVRLSAWACACDCEVCTLSVRPKIRFTRQRAESLTHPQEPSLVGRRSRASAHTRDETRRSPARSTIIPVCDWLSRGRQHA